MKSSANQRTGSERHATTSGGSTTTAVVTPRCSVELARPDACMRVRTCATMTKRGNCSDAVADRTAWIRRAESEDVAHPDVGSRRHAYRRPRHAERALGDGRERVNRFGRRRQPIALR
jgi:hypothetical protein